MYTRLLPVLVAAAVLVTGEVDRVCTRKGIQCKDCSTLSNCVEDSGGLGFHYEGDRSCPDHLACDELTLYCVRDGYCRYKKFECPKKNFEVEQVFPDPYSCVQYHGCQGKSQFNYECDPGTAFNPVSKDCSLKITDISCIDYPVPLCESDGQGGIIPGTDYVYTCVLEPGSPPILYPVLSLGGGVPSTLYRIAGSN